MCPVETVNRPTTAARHRITFMSCVCVLTPVVIAAWPAFSAAVMAAATSLGYMLVEETNRKASPIPATVNRVDLEVAQSELVMDAIHRDQRISVARDGVTVTFARGTRAARRRCA